MIRLKIKLALFNIFSKLAVTALFFAVMPFIIERVNLRQVDEELINKREEVISMISGLGIEPFITSDSTSAFGSYNILKEEYISLERYHSNEEVNYINVDQRLIEGETISYRVLHYSLLIDGNNYLLEVGRSLESIALTKKNTSTVIMVFLGFIIFLTFLTDFQYTRSILRPLDRITSKLEGVSNPELFDRLPVKTTTKDFKKLDETLIEMMNDIESLFRKEKDITINISHELMTPISILRSKLESLLINKNIDPVLQNKIEDSLRTLNRLQILVNSLLFIARIENRQYLKNESFAINQIITDIKNELEPIALDKSVELVLRFDNSCLFSNGNKSLIYSMFFNIINNAIKNSNKGGIIQIAGNKTGSGCQVEISDNGKGMTEEQLKNLFLRFKSRTENSGEGTGIGLAISKSIADYHNIIIEVDSKIDTGTKFLLKIPENS